MENFLQSHLDIIDEREIVLLEIERALFTQRYRLNQTHFDILSVQSISMIYSIWEGFVQKTFQQYIYYLNSLNIGFNELKDEIAIFHMENKFKQFNEYPKKTKGKISFYEQLSEHFANTSIPIYSSINTESNVSFEVLNRILKQFALEPFTEQWGEDYHYPKPNLKEMMTTFLRYRNGIAHGGDISSEEKVTVEVYEKYKKLVTDLMYGIYEKLQNAIENESYLKHLQ